MMSAPSTTSDAERPPVVVTLQGGLVITSPMTSGPPRLHCAERSGSDFATGTAL